MTIKLSTTNSVNKTLQHKALWGLETPYRDVGGRAGEGGGEGVSGATSGLQRWNEFFFFSSERDPQDSVSVQEEWRHFYLSSSVNKLSILTVQNDMISNCETLEEK